MWHHLGVATDVSVQWTLPVLIAALGASATLAAAPPSSVFGGEKSVRPPMHETTPRAGIEEGSGPGVSSFLSTG